MCAEANRLHRGARYELITGDALRKAHVVLDERAGTRLAPRGNRVEGDGIESLRRAVHRGRETGRTGTDDDEIAYVARDGPVGETEVLGKFAWCRVPKRRVRSQHDRHVARPEAETREIHRRVVDVLQVDPPMR